MFAGANLVGWVIEKFVAQKKEKSFIVSNAA
jgi:hypothetical protein